MNTRRMNANGPRTRSRTLGMLLAALPAVVLAACDSDSTGPADGEPVTIRFSAETSASGASAGPLAVLVDGTNGTLDITDLRVIVAELEFEGTNGTCGTDGDDDDDDDCFEVELPPRLVGVPLDGSPLTVTTAELPAGSYNEFELEIEDLEDDEDDTEFAQEIAALRAEILATFPDWPREATIRVEGTFTPTGGAAESFVAYVEGEVEVELDLVPPLDISDAGPAEHTLDVVLFPERWFVRGDGSVIDLTEYDFSTTGRLLELEVEIEDGFEVEFDDD
ncbi:MAG TPA: hypothetical protein VJ925_13940 [Longimicrobiales bacterium]|nr:hypothetical protein [Longimicrobiales bacterium]